MDENGIARVSDLGFAKVLTNPSSMTMSVSGGLIGTPAYMAPELWLDQKATKQTDQYSLACILVEMLTGTPLFDGESTPGIMTKHFQSLKLPVEVDESLKYGLETALQQKPEERWADVEEFVANVTKHDEGPIVTTDQSTEDDPSSEIEPAPDNETDPGRPSEESDSSNNFALHEDFEVVDNNAMRIELTDHMILLLIVLFTSFVIIVAVL